MKRNIAAVEQDKFKNQNLEAPVSVELFPHQFFELFFDNKPYHMFFRIRNLLSIVIITFLLVLKRLKSKGICKISPKTTQIRQLVDRC